MDERVEVSKTVRINLPLFSTVFPSNSCCFCPFVVITTLSTGLVGVEVTSTATRPVDNVVIRTKDLQDRNNNYLMDRR